jgi:DNA-binding NarL/FixJ family response regulator
LNTQQVERDTCRVVLADDMDDLRFLLALSLERAGGFEVVGHATNGVEAIDVAKQTQPDVLVLDLAMPVMDGMEAIPQIREVAPDTKIVMLTGFDSGDLSAHARTLGAHAYLEKSLALIDISSTLQEVCSG